MIWERKELREGLVRWVRKPEGLHIVIGDDSGNGRNALWGTSKLDEIDWSFGGWCVHSLDRAMELGDAVIEVLQSNPRRVVQSWKYDERGWGLEARVGEFNLCVNPWEQLVRGRVSSGTYKGYELKEGEERVNLWRWWLDFEHPEGGHPWIMKSWATWRNPETAMAYAEALVRAFSDLGFNRAEVVG